MRALTAVCLLCASPDHAKLLILRCPRCFRAATLCGSALHAPPRQIACPTAYPAAALTAPRLPRNQGVWCSEDDSRTMVAPSLRFYFEWWLSGQLKI